MADNLFETQYDITKKSKLIKLYEENKFLLFSFILILIIILGSFSFYLANKAKQKTLVSENYIKAKIFLENKNQAEAVRILKDVIYADDSIYSPLSFHLTLSSCSKTNITVSITFLSIPFDKQISFSKTR